MPYLMGGFPDLATLAAIGEAAAAAGADLLELGIPFSDPLADGPVIHAAATAALNAGASVDGVLDVAAALAPLLPVIVMTYVNVLLARGVERFVDRLASCGVSGLIVPDLPFEEADEVAGCGRGGRRRAGAAGRADDARRAARTDRRARARLPLRRVGHRNDRRARRRGQSDCAAHRARARPHRRARRARLRHLDAGPGGGRR